MQPLLIKDGYQHVSHNRRYAINCDKIKNKLGWERQFDFEEGLGETVKWYMNNQGWVDRVRSGKYKKWIERNYEMKKNAIYGNKPLVSIITPTYNHERFIEYCIKSVISQTYSNWEMLIIDDASSDRTIEIIKQYVKNDIRIKYLKHKENYGIYKLSESYNEALNISRGKFIAILEGDDCWPRDKLEKQLPLFNEDEVVLTWGRGAYISTEGKLIGLMPFPKINPKSKCIYQNKPIGIALKKLLIENFIVPTASIIIKKNTILSIGGFKQPLNIYFVDYPTWLELSLKGEFRFLNYVLGYWRRHSSQVTNLLSDKQLIEHVNLSTMFLKNLSKCRVNFYYNENIIMANNYWLMGKYKLVNKESNKARQYFWKVILKGSYKLKIKAIIGLLVSFFHINLVGVNKLYKISNKK